MLSSWQTTAFYSSLALWTVAVLFVAPETQEARTGWKRSGASTNDHILLNWRNVTITLFCAAVMWVGYRQLRLYMDEMADALAAGRTGLNLYNVDDAGMRFFGGDKATVTRSVLNCHDRATDFLESYSTDVNEIEEKLRASFRLLMDDINSWSNEVAMIARELRTVSSAPAPSTGPASNDSGGPDPGGTKGSTSLDNASPDAQSSLPRPLTGVTGSSAPQSSAPTKGTDKSMLVTKTRRLGKFPSGSTSGERSSWPPFKLLGAQADRDMEEVDVYSMTRPITRNVASVRNTRHVDPVRENTILNVRRRMNAHSPAEYSPERHAFDEPRPTAENLRLELEEGGAIPSSHGLLPDDMTSATPPTNTDEINQVVPWNAGDDTEKDVPPSPKDPTDDAAVLSSNKAAKVEHAQKEGSEPMPGDEQTTGDRL